MNFFETYDGFGIALCYIELLYVFEMCQLYCLDFFTFCLFVVWFMALFVVVCLFVCLFVCLSVCLSVFFVCLSVCLCVCLSVCVLSVCLSGCLFLCLRVWLCGCNQLSDLSMRYVLRRAAFC